MVSVLVQDEVLGKKAESRFSLDFKTRRITVAELIEGRVRAEVERYNREPKDYFKGLVQPSGAEPTLQGFHMKQGQAIDAAVQVEKALVACECNQVLVLIGDHQAESLQEEIAIEDNMTITFLRLVPLVGG